MAYRQSRPALRQGAACRLPWTRRMKSSRSGALDVHVISSLPVMPGSASQAWVDSQLVHMVWGGDSTLLCPDAVGDASDEKASPGPRVGPSSSTASAESSDLFWHDSMCLRLTPIVSRDPCFP